MFFRSDCSMFRHVKVYGFSRYLRRFSFAKNLLILLLIILAIVYIILKIRLITVYNDVHSIYSKARLRKCNTDFSRNPNRVKIILFWTKIFSTRINDHFLNKYLFQETGRCATDRCKLTNNRYSLCQSDAVVFHARGGISSSDMPDARLPEQRYVLLTKEPPYKTTAIVGHLNSFFNWTATYRVDSDINYRYFDWKTKTVNTQEPFIQTYLNNRTARAASMISNCYSENNRDDYIKRLNAIVPVTSIGYCTGNKCEKSRFECLNQLADTHPFYLSFENSLCNDYVTEKYANAILSERMIPIVFSKGVHLYIPNSFIDANQFSSPENLADYLIYLTKNSTAYDSYFQWRQQYELVVPDEYDYLCDLCRKLNDPNQPTKIYGNMKKWLYEDAKCQRWMTKLNRSVDIPVDETMDYEDPWF